jgi:hypothetical protein
MRRPRENVILSEAKDPAGSAVSRDRKQILRSLKLPQDDMAHPRGSATGWHGQRYSVARVFHAIAGWHWQRYPVASGRPTATDHGQASTLAHATQSGRIGRFNSTECTFVE